MQPCRVAVVLLGLALQCATVSAWGYCNDNDLSCASWANNKECEGSNAEVVKKSCPHSCSVCTHICRDVEAGCPDWAANGNQCKENPDFMLKNCPTSCGICKPKCYDKDDACGGWARNGECKKNPSITSTCPVSCGICSSLCSDVHNDCPQWANDGACGTNAAYMLRACPNSCGVCTDTTHAQSSHPTTRELSLTETRACADTDRTQCLIWGEHECDANPGAMMRDCPHTCGVCTLACEDKYADCPNWALGKGSMFGGKKTPRSGCDQDPGFMMLNCPHSCNLCPRLHVFPSRTDPA